MDVVKKTDVIVKMRKKGPITKAKERIQKLLTQIVRKRDGGCALADFPEAGKCGGHTMADHIRSRKYASTYARSENAVCLCMVHHLYWKRQNPLEWVKLIEEFLGKGWIDEVRKYPMKMEKPFTLKQWLVEEQRLIKELELINK